MSLVCDSFVHVHSQLVELEPQALKPWVQTGTDPRSTHMYPNGVSKLCQLSVYIFLDFFSFSQLVKENVFS
jgi:hypothetical protein